MHTDISDYKLDDHNIKDLQWGRDRNDVYRAWGQTKQKVTMTTRILYEIVEVKCDPDIDW